MIDNRQSIFESIKLRLSVDTVDVLEFSNKIFVVKKRKWIFLLQYPNLTVDNTLYSKHISDNPVTRHSNLIDNTKKQFIRSFKPTIGIVLSSSGSPLIP